MVKVLLLTFVYMICTISMAWGCVSGAGPSWEIGQPGRPGRRRPSSGRGLNRPGGLNPGEPAGPRIPDEVVSYLAGNISKELTFGSIDIDGNGLVSFEEWIARNGSATEFNFILIRLDTNGDNHISLAELQPFSLPTRSDSDTMPRLLNFKDVPNEVTNEGTTPRPRRRRPHRRRNRQRGRGRGLQKTP